MPGPDHQGLVDVIATALTEDGQYVEAVSAHDVDHVGVVRGCGRAAGRRLRRRVRTLVSDLSDGGWQVWVIDVEPDDPSDELARRRRARQLRAAVEAASVH